MASASRPFRRLRAGDRIILLVLLFATITLFTVIAADVRTQILDDVRAYVSGEALWSKAQKEAVQNLTRYAVTRDEEDFTRYLRAIEVPLGDRMARLEMEKPEPDLTVAHAGFAQGRNHPDDIPGLISLYLRFRNVSFMDEAIALWTEGDRLLDELQQKASLLHEEIGSGRPDEGRIDALVAEIARIDAELRPLEDGFSKKLGEGARWASVWLTRAVYAAAALLLLFGLLLARRMLRAERGEREGAALTRAIVDEGLDCIITADREGRILDFNPVAERTFGWKRAEVLGRTVAETIVPPAQREAHTEGLRRYEETGAPASRGPIELSALRKDGTEFPIELNVTAIQRGRHRIFAAHVRDLTERKRAEEASREAEARRRAENELIEIRNFVSRVADATPHIFYLADLTERRLLYVNKQLTSVLGYTAEDAERMTLEAFWSRFHPEDLVQLPTLITRAYESNFEEVIDIEFRIKDAWDQWRWLHARNIIFARDSASRPTQILGTAQDLTERKRAEERVRQHEEALAHVQRISTLGEMATGLAHELNQPLAAIVSFARGCSLRMRAGNARQEELLTAIDQISKEAMRAGDFIRHLRALATKQMPPREGFDPNGIVDDLERLVGPEARRLGVTLEIDLAASLPPVFGHRIQIEQVVLNLVRNGFDAMRNVVGPRTLRISTAVSDTGGVSIAVADTGAGIPPEAAQFVFEPFYTTKPDGMGMGLAISRSIVEGHGGRIRVAKNEPRGTIFSLELPRSGYQADDEDSEDAIRVDQSAIPELMTAWLKR